VAPQENSTSASTPCSANAFAGEVLGAVDVRVLRNGEHPADGLPSDFAVDHLADLVHVAAVFADPVVARDARVEEAHLDIARELLGADEADVEFLVVHARHVGAFSRFDGEAGLVEQGKGGLLETAFGQRQNQFRHGRDRSSFFAVCVGVGRVN